MPVYLNSKVRHDVGHAYQERSNGSLAMPGRKLSIGLINNMPDGALEATERQFLSLLDAASKDFSIKLSLYSLPGIPREKSGAEHIHNFYSSTETLWNRKLDGLIVTGREPLTANLADEPYWKDFTSLVDWAEKNTYSTIWSCLAAHAAVLYMDDVRRIKSSHKHGGVFDCNQLTDHPLLAGMSSRLRLPHSRWNGIHSKNLKACGYRVLTETADGDVDTFIQQGKSLFVFFQGHPEYESNTLMLEYRRDVVRYLRRETDIYPTMPHNYFDNETMAALKALEVDVMAEQRKDAHADMLRILEPVEIENTWHTAAECLYRNWLHHIGTQKMLRENEVSGAQEIRRLDGHMLTLSANRLYA